MGAAAADVPVAEAADTMSAEAVQAMAAADTGTEEKEAAAGAARFDNC